MFPSSQFLLAGHDTHSHRRTQLLHQPAGCRNCCAATDHSSGTDYCGHGQDLSDRAVGSSPSINEPSSMCLRAMVEEYMEGNEGDADAYNNLVSGRVEGTTEAAMFPYKRAIKEIESILKSGDASTKQLREHVVRALDEPTASFGTPSNCRYEHNLMRRSDISSDHKIRLLLVKRLKKLGYKASICKTIKPSCQRGGAVNGLPLDEHEYVDVLVEDELDESRAGFDGGRSGSRSDGGGSSSSNDELTERRADGKNADKMMKRTMKKGRVIIEVGMRDQFRVARPCEGYGELLQAVPELFVGGAEALQRLVRVMVRAARASLEAQGMLVPPWRSLSFMLAKWLSPSYHRRTSTSPSPSLRQSDLLSVQPDAAATASTAHLNFDTPLNIQYAPASSHHRIAAAPQPSLPPRMKTACNTATRAAHLPTTDDRILIRDSQAMNAELRCRRRLVNTNMLQFASTAPSPSGPSSRKSSRKVAGALALALQNVQPAGPANHHQYNTNSISDRNVLLTHPYSRALTQPDPFPRHCNNTFIAAQ